MSMDAYDALWSALCPHVVAARHAVLAVFRQAHVKKETKADQSPVTEADRRSQEILVSALRQLTPAVPVLSEEEIAELPSSTSTYWLVDPLDGTREFLQKRGEFTINLALVERGKPIFGVLDVPVAADTYVAYCGQAWVWDRQGQRRAVTCSPLGAGGWLWVSSARDRQSLDEWLRAHAALAGGTRYAGSALKFAWVAQGLADAYVRWSPSCGWDTAAGQALVEAAGGAVYDLTSGQRLDYQPDRLDNPPCVAVGRDRHGAGRAVVRELVEWTNSRTSRR
jgi:3'(2'), 5'-bisphosphate nucleotidase